MLNFYKGFYFILKYIYGIKIKLKGIIGISIVDVIIIKNVKKIEFLNHLNKLFIGEYPN